VRKLEPWTPVFCFIMVLLMGQSNAMVLPVGEAIEAQRYGVTRR